MTYTLYLYILQGDQKDCTHTGESIRGLTPEEIRAHMEYKRKLNSGELSASIGSLIALGTHFTTTGVKEVTDAYIATVAPILTGTMSDVVLSYAIVLWFAKQLC